MSLRLLFVLLGIIGFLLTIIVALFASDRTHETLDNPHPSCKRNGVEAVPSWIMKDCK